MILAINDYKTIGDLQEHFNLCFPHFKVEFYMHPQRWNEPADVAEQIDPDRRIGEVSRRHKQDLLEIKSWYQAAKVEHDLRKLYGLNVRIFKFENEHWVQIAPEDRFSVENRPAISPNQLNDSGLADSEEVSYPLGELPE